MRLPVYVHNVILEPGASVGEHEHPTSEEIYWLLEGDGVMSVNGREFTVSSGDVTLTQEGSRHGLRNTGSGPLRIAVIGGEV
jgi:mannose-6-phosphate isomerase-like protein (cupin superfamily)